MPFSAPSIPFEKLPNLVVKDDTPRLYLYGLPLEETAMRKDITRESSNLSMTMDIKIGYDSMTFDYDSGDYASVRQFFINNIGSLIKAKKGGAVVWEGLVWEMDLTHNGVVRRISMDNVFNKVKIAFTNIDTDERETTIFYANDASKAKYGHKETILNLDKVSLATANKYATMKRAELSFPRALPVSINPNSTTKSSLRVTCVGLFYTLNYQYVSLGDGNRGISNSIETVLTNDSEYVTAATITENTLQIGNPSNEVKAGDWLLSILEIGNGTTPYTMQVWNDGRLNYRPMSNIPEYVYDGSRLRTIGGRNIQRHKWWMKPGVLRDLTWSSQPLNSVMFLNNGQDAVIESVTINDKNELPILKTNEYNDSDLYYELLNIDLFVPDEEEED